MSMLWIQTGRLAGVCLALAGLAPVFYFLTLLGWQYAWYVQTRTWVALPASLAFADHSALHATSVAPLAYLPELPSTWVRHEALAWLLERLHIGAVFALMGLLVTWLGVRIVLRRNEILRIEKQAREDRLRRVRLRQYGEAERLEPYIGPGTPAGNDADPTAPRKEAA